MSKKNNRARRPNRVVPRQDPAENEHRAADAVTADAVTTAWVLTMMTTLAAEAVGATVWALQAQGREVQGRGAQWPIALVALPGLMWFVALVTGTVFLILTVPVYRLRVTPPPPTFTALGVIASTLPFLLWIWQLR